MGRAGRKVAVIALLCVATGGLMGVAAWCGPDLTPPQRSALRVTTALLFGLIAGAVIAYLRTRDSHRDVALRLGAMFVAATGTFLALPYIDEASGAASTRRLTTEAVESLAAANSAKSRGDHDDAERLYDDAADQFAEAELPQQTAKSLLGRATAALANDELDDAERTYREVLALPDAGTQPGVAAAANVGLGRVAMKRMKLQETEQHFGAARRLVESTSDERGRANVALAIGELRLKQERWSDARESFAAAEVGFSGASDPAGAARAALGVGDAEFGAGRFESAQKAFGRAAKTFADVGDVVGEANARRRLGATHRELTNVNEARKSYERAAELYQKANSSAGVDNVRADLKMLHPEPQLSAVFCSVPPRNGREYFDFGVRANWSAADVALVKSVNFEFNHSSLDSADGAGVKVGSAYSKNYRGWGCAPQMEIEVTYLDGEKRSFDFDMCKHRVEDCPGR